MPGSDSFYDAMFFHRLIDRAIISFTHHPFHPSPLCYFILFSSLHQVQEAQKGIYKPRPVMHSILNTQYDRVLRRFNIENAPY